MDSKKKKKIEAELSQQIEEFASKRAGKKKKKGWLPSKLDAVSHVLLELRRQGRSLQFMVEFVFDKFKISSHKTTVMRQLKKLELQKKDPNYAEQK